MKIVANIFIEATRYLYNLTKTQIQRQSNSKNTVNGISYHRSINTTNAPTTLEQPNKSGSLTADELKEIEDFRARHPFIKVNVPPISFSAFIQEYEWLENRIGKPPTYEDQISILKSINNM